MKGRRIKRLLTALAVALALISPNVVLTVPAQAASSYRVTFDANGGFGTMTSQSVSIRGSKLSSVKFIRDDFKFAGWALSPAGAVKYKNKAVFKPRKKTTLYAKWTLTATAPVLAGHTLGSLYWSDQFQGVAGSKINPANWTARYCGHADTNGGGTCHNGEPQWYTPDAIALDGTTAGNAVITTKRVTSAPPNSGDCLASPCHYTSGRFDTQGKVSFKFGYIEARIKMPTGGANWPAFWALGDSISSVGWPLSGEIDIAEQGGNLPMRASTAVHYSSVNQATCCGNHRYIVQDLVNVANYQTDFHTYGMAWLPSRMEFYVDRQKFYTVTPSDINGGAWVFDLPFFLILNNATGGFGGDYTGWSQSQMTIDYVQAWTLDGQGELIRHQ